jgi:hypothetical protein
MQEKQVFLGGGQRPLVPLLLLGPSIFPIILFLSTTLLNGMAGISLHMQSPLTSQSHGREKQLLVLEKLKLLNKIFSSTVSR